MDIKIINVVGARNGQATLYTYGGSERIRQMISVCDLIDAVVLEDYVYRTFEFITVRSVVVGNPFLDLRLYIDSL